jgi:hypothetical protein
LDNKILAKLVLVAAILFILAALALAFLMFALRDGPIGSTPFVIASLLLGAGIILLVVAKKTYGA